MEKVKKYGYMFIFMIFVITSLSINYLFKQMDSSLTSIEIRDNEVEIMYNTYNINDIVDIELLDEVSLSGGSGSNTPNTNNGSYKVNGDKFESRVYIHKNISPFIKLTIKDSVIVFNEDNEDKTRDVYNKLLTNVKLNNSTS